MKNKFKPGDIVATDGSCCMEIYLILEVDSNKKEAYSVFTLNHHYKDFIGQKRHQNGWSDKHGQFHTFNSEYYTLLQKVNLNQTYWLEYKTVV